MSTEGPSEEVAVTPGTQLPAWETSVSTARQRRYLVSCEVDAARYGDVADVSILGTDCFLSLRRARMRIDRLVHLEQRLIQHGPVAIGEQLAIRGNIQSVVATGVGDTVRAVFEFLRADGSVAVTAETLTLDSDPGKNLAEPPKGANPGTGFRRLTRKLLTPTKVQAYIEEIGNRIHFDPAYAVRYGLRAPLASGLMAVTWVVEAIAADGMPQSFELTAKFLAPLFWDDGVDVLAERRSKKGAKARRIRIVSAAGAMACEAEIRAVEP